MLVEFEQDNIVGVTRPSFELYLLLHLENACDTWIFPHEEEIFENRKSGKRRYIDRLFAEASGMNPKTNEGIRILAADHERAVKQESRINNDPHKACRQITSNIGKIIDEIKHFD